VRDHPDIAIRLNNLARLLRDTSRLVEAEPLMQRMVQIFVAFTRPTGHPHPRLDATSGNYQALLKTLEGEAEIGALFAELLAPAASILAARDAPDQSR
jgi:hypothetical protein